MTTWLSLTCASSAETILALATTTGGKKPAASQKSGKHRQIAVASAESLINILDIVAATPATAILGTSPGDSTTPSSSLTGNTNEIDSNGVNGLSKGEIGGIIVAAVTILVAIVVGWWKRHQVLWLFTCGLCGYRHSVWPQPVYSSPSEHQLNNHGGNGGYARYNGPVYYNGYAQGSGTNGYYNYS